MFLKISHISLFRRDYLGFQTASLSHKRSLIIFNHAKKIKIRNFFQKIAQFGVKLKKESTCAISKFTANSGALRAKKTNSLILIDYESIKKNI